MIERYTPEEAREYLEAASQFYAGIAARRWYGDHVCLAAHPRTVNGSPDDIVEDGAESGAELTGKWANQVVSYLDGATTESSVRQALRIASNDLDVEPFAKLLHEKTLLGLMLGVLDAAKEHESLLAGNSTFAPIQFLRDAPLSRQPLKKALELWEQRKIMSRERFDALSQKLKQRAFTFAGTARDDLLAAAHAELEKQMREGNLNFRDFKKFAAARLESAGWTPANRSHVETIFRTNVNSALASGRHAEQTRPDVLAALPYWQIRGVPDARARETHKRAHNIVLPANHEFWRLAYPPFGYNCFLPGTEIRGNVIGASRAWYAGKAVEFLTAKGRRLTVTANHPVLTTKGFVAACTLRNGNQLVGYLGESGVSLLRTTTKRDEDHGPARADQVFRALSEAHPVRFTRTRADNFHGEAQSFVGEIEVVGSYWDLVSEPKPASLDEALQFGFEATASAGPRRGASYSSLEWVHLSTTSAPGLSALTLDGFGVRLQRSPLHEFCFGLPAHLDAIPTEEASEGRARNTDLFRELLHRGSPSVEVDEVVKVREFEFCGHVYDFETTTGWLFADSVAASNCRCTVISRTAAWIRRTGIKIGPVPRDLPDPGFASGTRGLIVVPAQLERSDSAVRPVPQPVPVPQPAPPEPTLILPDVTSVPVPQVPIVPPVSVVPVGPRAPGFPVGPNPFPAGGPASLPPPPMPLPTAPLTEAQQHKALVDSFDRFTAEAKALKHVFGGALPTVEQLDAISGRAVLADASVFVQSFGKSVVTTLRSKDGKVEIVRTLSLKRGKLMVKHDLFLIDEAFQGQGLGKRVLRRQFEEYARLGVSRIDIDPAWKGKYVWPRMGFTLADSKDWPMVQQRFREYLTSEGVEGASAIVSQLKNVQDIALAQIDGKPHGKEFLLGFRGLPSLKMRLDPRDPGYRYLLRYLGLSP